MPFCAWCKKYFDDDAVQYCDGCLGYYCERDYPIQMAYYHDQGVIA